MNVYIILVSLSRGTSFKGKTETGLVSPEAHDHSQHKNIQYKHGS